jgi:hypothetical protein
MTAYLKIMGVREITCGRDGEYRIADPGISVHYFIMWKNC